MVACTRKPSQKTRARGQRWVCHNWAKTVRCGWSPAQLFFLRKTPFTGNPKSGPQCHELWHQKGQIRFWLNTGSLSMDQASF